MLQNEDVCGNTIYSSSEASGVNNDLFSKRAKPELKTWLMVLPCTSELCSCISLSCGVLVTQFLRKQCHVTSHVFEVA